MFIFHAKYFYLQSVNLLNRKKKSFLSLNRKPSPRLKFCQNSGFLMIYLQSKTVKNISLLLFSTITPVYLFKKEQRWRVGPDYERKQAWLYTKRNADLNKDTKWYQKGHKCQFNIKNLVEDISKIL